MFYLKKNFVYVIIQNFLNIVRFYFLLQPQYMYPTLYVTASFFYIAYIFTNEASLIVISSYIIFIFWNITFFFLI